MKLVKKTLKQFLGILFFCNLALVAIIIFYTQDCFHSYFNIKRIFNLLLFILTFVILMNIAISLVITNAITYINWTKDKNNLLTKTTINDTKLGYFINNIKISPRVIQLSILIITNIILFYIVYILAVDSLLLWVLIFPLSIPIAFIFYFFRFIPYKIIKTIMETNITNWKIFIFSFSLPFIFIYGFFMIFVAALASIDVFDKINITDLLCILGISSFYSFVIALVSIFLVAFVKLIIH